MSDAGSTASRPMVLLVDDDPLITESLSFILEEEFTVYIASNREAAKQQLQSLSPPPPLALIDLGLAPLPHQPDEGFALIAELLAFNPVMKILVLSGQDKRINVQHALTLGAVDFVAKPADADLLIARLRHQLLLLDAETRPAETAADGTVMLGESGAIETLRALITQFADTPFPVLIEGESGTGKELVAQCLHDESSRAPQPLLSINCAAFTPELLEAQLFGHARGAFTGANVERSGFFEDAGKGSLFLDEIGEFPLELQPKLLRVLENGEYYRVGETQSRLAQARIMAATNRDLREEIRRGRFRHDLYHRLSVLTVTVTPLRDRGNDSLLLLDYFQNLYAATVAPFQLDEEAQHFLRNYGFPGNIRELRNIVIRLGAKYPGQRVTVENLKPELEMDVIQTSDRSTVDETAKQQLMAAGFRLDDTLAEWERRYIEAALELCGGNLSKAARTLGVNRTTLYSRIERLKIETQQEL